MLRHAGLCVFGTRTTMLPVVITEMLPLTTCGPPSASDIFAAPAGVAGPVTSPSSPPIILTTASCGRYCTKGEVAGPSDRSVSAQPSAPARSARGRRQYSTEPDQNSGEKSETKPFRQLSFRRNRLFISSGPGKWGRMWECGLACRLRVYVMYWINLLERRIIAPR